MNLPRRRSVAARCLGAACLVALLTPLPVLAAEKPAPIAPDPRWPFVTAAPADKQAGQGGIGMTLEVRGDTVVVGQTVPGGPAARAGMQAGDVIVKVEAWTTPPGAKVADVAEHVRGKPGQPCKIELRRGATTLTVTVVREPLDRLFPPAAKNLMNVKSGLALLASGSRHTLGLRFDTDGKVGEPLGYTWRMAAGEQALEAAQSGAGVVVVDATGGAVVQVGDWRIELKGLPDSGVFVATSNLPVHEPAPAAWLQVAPPWPSVVKPRSAPPKRAVRWSGTAKLALQAALEGKPLAGRRITLRLADAAGQQQDSATAVTDAQGRFQLAVPAGAYRVTGLQPSQAGGGRDVFYEAELAVPPDAIAAGDNPTPVALALRPKPAPTDKPALDWGNDERVGQGLPPLPVTRWFGLPTAPKSLAGSVLLLDVWATWCGPCRATNPMVAELYARLAPRGLRVVAASIDRDEAAIEEHAREVLPGAAPIAWVGPDAMQLLDLESVPTFIVVDHKGRVRGVHKGTGWTVDALEAWLTTLLDETKRK